jgi:glycosyltransferase involved in cell wall biosynthesis
VKLLFIIHSLKFGGAERQLVELIKGLNHHSYDVHLICLDNVSEGYTELLSTEGIETTYFLRSYKYDLRPIFSIYRFILKKQIDLVHTFENLGSMFGLLAAKLSRRPVVCSAVRNAKDKNLKLKLSTKILSKFADIFVANSRAGFVSRFSKIKPHFRVVYNGIDFNRFKNDKVDILKIKKEIGVVDFNHVIGMIASLSTHKDHETLLNAAPMVLQKYPELCFLFIGDGREREKLESKVRRLGLKENVLFLGYRNDVDQVIQILDIAVLLTNSDVILEGISNAIVEAMAVGVTVVASKGGGTNEIIKHDVNGILVSPKSVEKTAEAIIELLEDKTKAKRLATTAKIFVTEKFSLQRYVEEYENIYQDLNSKRK